MIALISGYIASVILAISLMVSNDLTFRWLNTGGCLVFIVYGILINAFPVILTNSLLLLINTFYLIKIYTKKENFELVEFEPAAAIVNKFLSFYEHDIKNYFPEFKKIESANNIRFVVLRDIVLANIFAATLKDDGTAVVNINYTVARYRDYKVGKFIFEREKRYLLSKGVKQLIYLQALNKKHARFLTVMGFKKEINERRAYFVKDLS